MRIGSPPTPFNAVRLRTGFSTERAIPPYGWGEWEGRTLLSLAALATLTISSAGPLWSRFCEGALFLLALYASLRPPHRSLAGELDLKIFLPLGGIALWGAGQLLAGATVYRYATLDGSLRLAACVTAAYVAALARPTRLQRDGWLESYCWFSTGLALVSVLSYYSSPGKILWILPAVYPDNWGPFPSRNNFAQFLELSFPVGMYLHDGVRGRRGLAGDRLFALLPPAILFACGVACASRAGLLLLVAEALTVAFLLRRRTAKLWRFVPLTALLIPLFGAGTLVERFKQPDPLAGRREILPSTWELIRSRPWTGYGLGTFPYVYPEFAERDLGTRVDHAHNDWLEWASEGGFAFAGLWLFAAISIARRALGSIWGLGVLAVFVHAIVDYPFSRLGVALWAFVLLGFLASVDAAGARPSSKRIGEQL